MEGAKVMRLLYLVDWYLRGRWKINVPQLQFASGRNAFKAPYGYGFAYKDMSHFESIYYLIPLNYIARFWRWLNAQWPKQKKAE